MFEIWQQLHLKSDKPIMFLEYIPPSADKVKKKGTEIKCF